jgi:uncharacterized protein with FMN-binding domain
MINSSSSGWRRAGGLAALVAGVGLVVGLKSVTGGPSTVQPIALPPSAAPVTGGASTTTAAPASSAATPPTSSSPRDVLGDVAPTPYGPVQVELVLTGTRIVDVRALQTPDAASRSRRIASLAVPQLRTEVLTAQAARIDSVSGATYTSQGYAESVQYAIDHE